MRERLCPILRPPLMHSGREEQPANGGRIYTAWRGFAWRVSGLSRSTAAGCARILTSDVFILSAAMEHRPHGQPDLAAGLRTRECGPRCRPEYNADFSGALPSSSLSGSSCDQRVDRAAASMMAVAGAQLKTQSNATFQQVLLIGSGSAFCWFAIRGRGVGAAVAHLRCR